MIIGGLQITKLKKKTILNPLLFASCTDTVKLLEA
jgi:hypothetical protein